MTPIAPQNVLRHELIGLTATISHSKDPSLRGIRGEIVDESKNMVILVKKGKKVRVPKSIATFRLKVSGGAIVDVEGSHLVGRPENRLKTRVRRW